MSTLLETYDVNKVGRDFAIGDIHGNFTGMMTALKAIDFNQNIDRLFAVGDLIDRGPESAEFTHYLSQPWFYSIRGNHEQFAIMHGEGRVPKALWERNGGAWFYGQPAERQKDIIHVIEAMPLAIEVATTLGQVGIVHAEVPRDRWDGAANWKFMIDNIVDPHIQDIMIWNRERVSNKDKSIVKNIRAVIVGHTPVKLPVCLGNTYYIDTMGWHPDMGGYFTLIDLESLDIWIPGVNC